MRSCSFMASTFQAFAPSVDRQREHSSRLGFVAAIAALVVLALVLMLTDSKKPALAVGGIASIAIVWWGAAYTSKHHEWVVLPIELIFAVIGFSFFSDVVRAPVHYGLLVIFCAPLIPTALQSGDLKLGEYKHYLIYLGFAAMTTLYSLAPAYSIARAFEATLIVVALIGVLSKINDAEGVERILSHYFIACAIITAIMVLSLGLPHSLCWVSPAASFEPSMLQEMQKAGVQVDGIDRFQSLFSGPNDVGAIMLVTIGTGLVCWGTASRRRRMLIAAVMMGAVLCGALADSRSPFVALAIGITCCVIWRYRWRGILGLVAAAACIAGALVASGHDFSAYIDRGNVTTLTGRTEMWMFVIHQIAAAPILGYGYEVGGALFDNRFFPLWWGPWDQGVHVSIHNGYLAHAAGVGIPMTIFWLYIMLRPWVFIMRRSTNEWRLKQVFFLLLIPILAHNMSEVMADDGLGIVGFMFGLSWVIAERYRLFRVARDEAETAKQRAAMPRAVAAFVP
jgi:O-antigen ligase